MSPLHHYHQLTRSAFANVYPYEFRAYYFWEVDQDSSLELEEIRALFRGLLFTPALGKSLALLLRKQRDRFMLPQRQRDAYDNYLHDHPRSQATHRLICNPAQKSSTLHIITNGQITTDGE